MSDIHRMPNHRVIILMPDHLWDRLKKCSLASPSGESISAMIRRATLWYISHIEAEVKAHLEQMAAISLVDQGSQTQAVTPLGQPRPVV